MQQAEIYRQKIQLLFIKPQVMACYAVANQNKANKEEEKQNNSKNAQTFEAKNAKSVEETKEETSCIPFPEQQTSTDPLDTKDTSTLQSSATVPSSLFS